MLCSHTWALSYYLYQQLRSLVHWNGQSVVHLYGPCQYQDASQQGPILAFNIKRADGCWVGYKEVEAFAFVEGIHLRTGYEYLLANHMIISIRCFCNPGACQKFLELSTQEVIENVEVDLLLYQVRLKLPLHAYMHILTHSPTQFSVSL